MKMKKPITFDIEKKGPGPSRAGIIRTPHGDIHTPAFVVVGTKATVKALTPEQVKSLGTEVTLANTYHLMLQPGDELVKKAGGLHSFMNWQGPMFTDSGGFQVFSLGTAYGKGVSKVAKGEAEITELTELPKKARIDEEGVTFKSHIDGSEQRITPEKSIDIQHNLGADMIFVFDECTSPTDSYEYQKNALERTHRWAKRCLEYHVSKENSQKQGLFGIVQGGQFEDLRKESARFMAEHNFSGYGIGGSFTKDDMATAVKWVNEILPENKPRHLLGIGEPLDIFLGVENGCDTFDCVSPTRQARNGALYTKDGRINIFNSKFTTDFSPIEEGCECYTCAHYTKAYLSHLFRAKEILANTLASIHNEYFIVHMVKKIRESILSGTFDTYKKNFLERYYATKEKAD